MISKKYLDKNKALNYFQINGSVPLKMIIIIKLNLNISKKYLDKNKALNYFQINGHIPLKNDNYYNHYFLFILFFIFKLFIRLPKYTNPIKLTIL